MTCTFDRWSPKIGDPSVMGWVTVAAYLLAAALSLRVAMRGQFSLATIGRERAFWIFLTVLMVLMAVNKQLDLQSFMTATGRCISKLQGWYRERRSVQQGFVLVLGLLTSGFGLWLLLMMRRTLRRTAIALLGTVTVLGFVLIRAVGFHDVDSIINHTFNGVRMNWVLELSGLVLISLGALLHPKRPRRSRSYAEHRS